eukprot:COSAG01_NODE_3277_length_6316_cov_10.522921_4_plen_67_part_00
MSRSTRWLGRMTMTIQMQRTDLPARQSSRRSDQAGDNVRTTSEGKGTERAYEWLVVACGNAGNAAT